MRTIHDFDPPKKGDHLAYALGQSRSGRVVVTRLEALEDYKDGTTLLCRARGLDGENPPHDPKGEDKGSEYIIGRLLDWRGTDADLYEGDWGWQS